MGKQPVRMKAVIYALSPFQQKIMTGLWNDLTGKIHHKISENWISAALLITPVVGTYTYFLFISSFLSLSFFFIFEISNLGFACRLVSSFHISSCYHLKKKNQVIIYFSRSLVGLYLHLVGSNLDEILYLNQIQSGNV